MQSVNEHAQSNNITTSLQIISNSGEYTTFLLFVLEHWYLPSCKTIAGISLISGRVYAVVKKGWLGS